MNRREFLKGSIGGAIGCIVGKAAPNKLDDENDAEEWWLKQYRQLEEWYHEVCYEREILKRQVQIYQDCRKAWEGDWYRTAQERDAWRDYAVHLRIKNWGKDQRAQVVESDGVFEIPDGTISTLPPSREPWPPTPGSSTPIGIEYDMQEWLDEDGTEWVRPEQGRVFFVGDNGAIENDGLAPDRALPSIKDALEECDCSASVVIHYGQCEGEQT